MPQWTELIGRSSSWISGNELGIIDWQDTIEMKNKPATAKVIGDFENKFAH